MGVTRMPLFVVCLFCAFDTAWKCRATQTQSRNQLLGKENHWRVGPREEGGGDFKSSAVVCVGWLRLCVVFFVVGWVGPSVANIGYTGYTDFTCSRHLTGF
jgi:hypothetical protein